MLLGVGGGMELQGRREPLELVIPSTYGAFTAGPAGQEARRTRSLVGRLQEGAQRPLGRTEKSEVRLACSEKPSEGLKQGSVGVTWPHRKHTFPMDEP